MKLFRQELRAIVLAALTGAAVLLGMLNLYEQGQYRLPDDGVFWVDSESGVIARAIAEGGAGARAGVEAGDRLVSVNGVPVLTAAEATRKTFEMGAGAQARYQVFRPDGPAELDLTLEAQQQPDTVRGVLRLVGVLYLLLGIFVLFRRLTAPRATHFYLFCLASFVLFVFSYTGKLDALDWTIYWGSVIALLLQPALFLHFCLKYPETRQEKEGRAGAAGRALTLFGIYAPGAALGLIHVAVATGWLRAAAPLSELRWLLDRLEMGYLAGVYLAGIAVLAVAYWKARSGALRKQLAWVLGGALLAVVPFAAFYAIPYFLGVVPSAWMNFSVLALVFLPVALAYAIVRYRLLEVDIALGRGAAYTLATGTLVGLYLGVAALAGDFFRTHFPAAGTVGLVLAVIATGLLFQPLQRWIQSRLEQRFGREQRYDYRKALLAFGRELSSETDLDRMIASLLGQLARTLKIERAAILLPDAEGRFRLRGAVGMGGSESSESSVPSVPSAFAVSPEFRGDFGFLALLGGAEADSAENQRERLFFPDGPEGAAGLGYEEGPEAQSDGWRRTIARMRLPYYFACRAKNRLVAVLGLGRTEEGELLSEEDAALVETLAGYLAIAVENVRLIESLAAKADQYEQLQQFSENILESINVGLAAVDLEDRIQSVNTPLELLFPLPFRQARGKKLSEVFPADLAEQFERFRDDQGIHNIYRYRVRKDAAEDSPNGSPNDSKDERVLDIAVAPLLSKDCDCIGRLIIFDDVTDRVALESQLAQAEKLSSVGLLAAGVAHEVNTPLTVISTQAQMLAKQMPSGDRTSKILDKIISQTFRASEIINSLLNFSRTKGSRFAEVELNRVISDTLLLLDHQLKAAHIEVESRLEAGLAPISGNGDKLQQIFLNLFLNAKDAMPEGGRLRVASWTEDSVVRVEITDTGIGIPREHLNRIYDPFFTTKSAGRGTGLGLAVSYGIIHEHAGKIQVESRPGLGTRFRLEFPVLRKAVPA